MDERTHAWAEAKVRETLRRCVLSLCAQLQRKGRANMGIESMRVAGREQMAQAAAIREQARRRGIAK